MIYIYIYGLKGKFGHFESNNPKPENPCLPKLVCMNLTSIPTCIMFWADSDRLNFFTPMDYNSPWSEREIWPFLKAAVSPKP